MPLLDHFHPPWSKQRPWEGFHSAWATSLAQRLNHGLLPPHHVAIPQISMGGPIEIDVATMRLPPEIPQSGSPQPWIPPGPTLVEDFDLAGLDTFEIQILRDEDSPRLVAAIELVSPANKDRAALRQAFTIKCAGYLQGGIGLLLVDVVTSRSGNFHQDLLRLLHGDQNGERPPAGALYASAYRTFKHDEKFRLEAWVSDLALQMSLPTMPLWLGPDHSIPVPLEETYMTAREWLLMT